MRHPRVHANLAGERQWPLGVGASSEVAGIEGVVNGRLVDREPMERRLGSGATELVLSGRRFQRGSRDLVDAGGGLLGGATELVEWVERLPGGSTGMGEAGGGSGAGRPERLGWREAWGWLGQIGRRVLVAALWRLEFGRVGAEPRSGARKLGGWFGSLLADAPTLAVGTRALAFGPAILAANHRDAVAASGPISGRTRGAMWRRA